MNPTFDQVSDTALLVAAARALESEREDGFVSDPLAAKLAGERGMLLARSMAVGTDWVSLGVGLRSRFIDEFITDRLEEGGIDTVLNLGAGLDTRPWRLALPETLRWIEVDFPHVITYKSQTLSEYLPQCRLEQVSADLTSPDTLPRVFNQASTTSKGTLLLTEGLLMYLSAESTERIAREAYERPAFRYWIYDIMSNALQRIAHGDTMDEINQLRADVNVEGDTVDRVLQSAGWSPVQRRNIITDGGPAAEKRVQEIVAGMLARGQVMPETPADDGHTGIWLYTVNR